METQISFFCRYGFHKDIYEHLVVVFSFTKNVDVLMDSKWVSSSSQVLNTFFMIVWFEQIQPQIFDYLQLIHWGFEDELILNDAWNFFMNWYLKLSFYLLLNFEVYGFFKFCTALRDIKLYKLNWFYGNSIEGSMLMINFKSQQFLEK